MRTKFTLLPSFIAILFIFSACQKELSFNDPIPIGTTTGTSTFNLLGAPSTCTSPVINGVYQQGTAADTSNYITLQVNVDSVGTYNIVSSPVNGITFTTSGTFISTGLQTIKLSAAGTPGADGSFNFTPVANGCTFSITFLAGTQPPVTNTDCKDCIYVPVCVGSKYVFNDTTGGAASVRNIDYLATADTTIDGKVYQKIITNSIPNYFNCTNGETTLIGYQVTSAAGNVLQEYKSTMIKANEAVGTTWTSSLVNPLGQTVIQNFKIEAKGITRIAGGFTFNDVIVVSLDSGIELPGVGYYSASLSNYYYAKGVGLVEMTTVEPTSGQTIYHSVVKSYFIP